MREFLVSRRTFVALAAAAPALGATGSPQGRIETMGPLGPDDNQEPRIRVWLPPGYEDGARSYRALYMLDGQFAFASDSGGQNFAADRHVAKLAANGSIQPALIVAIDNLGEDRFLQYMPQAIYDQAEGSLRDT